MKNIMRNCLAAGYLLHVALIVIMASVPPVSRDALIHHLAIPKLWVEYGGIYEIPDIKFSYYPQLVDLFYTLPLFFNYDIAAKYIHFAFALLTALIIFFFIRRKIGPYWGALGGLMFLTIPVIIKLSVTVYVDLGFIFFSTASIFSIIIWLEHTNRKKWLVIAAIFSGLALSSKYNAFISYLVLSLIVPLFFLKHQNHQHRKRISAIQYFLIFSCISLLIFSPWLIRNYSLTGNPVYPLLKPVFSSEETTISPFKKKKQPILIRKYRFKESLPYTLLIPLRVFYEGKDDDPRYFDGRLNPLLLILPLTLLLLMRNQNFHTKEISVFSIYAFSVVLLTFFTVDMRIRYIAAIIPPLIVLSVYALFLVENKIRAKWSSGKLSKLITVSLILLFFVPNMVYAVVLFQKIEPMPYLSGKIDRATYIQRYRPEYDAIVQANNLVPDDGKLLGIFLGNRRYYFDVDVDVVLVDSIFTEIAVQSSSAEDIERELSRHGFTHLLIRYESFIYWWSTIGESKKLNVNRFFSTNSKILYAKSKYVLYEISQQ